MRQTLSAHSWIKCVSCLVAVLLMSACTTASTLVQLDKSVHFVTPAGTDVVVKPGVYRVEPAGDSEIQLLSEPGAAPVVLHAEFPFELSGAPDVSDPTAMMIIESDAYAVILRQPGRLTLAARGSVSGIQSRDVFRTTPLRAPEEFASKKADLVGCIYRYIAQVCCVCWTACKYATVTGYGFQVTNLGNAPASWSTARFTSSKQSVVYGVDPISPGQTWKMTNYYGKFFYEETMGPRPWTWSVDVGNAVAELNEANNMSGECP